MIWTQDPATGDIAAAQTQDDDALLLRHRDAATGDETDVLLEDVGGAESIPAAIGDGEFVVLSATNEEVLAHDFDGVDWQAPATIGSGIGLGSIHLVGTAGGRAVASWNDDQWGAYAAAFDRETGWTDTLTAHPSNPDNPTFAAYNRAAIDDGGFFLVWSTRVDDGTSAIRTNANEFDGVAFDASLDIDPGQDSDYTRVRFVQRLGPQHVRGVWRRYDELGPNGPDLYACHTPISGWSEAVEVDGLLQRVEDRPGGDVLIMTVDDDSNGYAEYFTAE